MPTITEQAAQRYASAVIDVLADYFPSLKNGSLLGRAVPGDIARQAVTPTRAFELIISYTREWRLHPAPALDDDQWRVRIGCHKDNWTEADIRFSDRINARLRAIKMED